MPRQCVNGFIPTYLDYTSRQQSPQSFHTWTIIGVIAATLGRRVWLPSSGSPIEEGYYNIYPNFYNVLVSPSGVGMKSTALNIGTDLIRLADLPIEMLQGKITATRLIGRLAAVAASSVNGNAELFVISSEFKVFTKGVMKDSSILEDLTHLYDCVPFDYETEHGMREQIQRPCININAGSTPEWLSGGSAGDIMSGGFGARIIPVTVLKDEKEIAWATKTPLETALLGKLLTDLKSISTLSGQFYVTKPAKDYFEKWYLQRKAQRSQLDSRLDGYFSKRHDKVLKLAMIMSVAMTDDMIIDIIHVSTAITLLLENEKNLLFAYSGATASAEVKYRDQVLAKVRELGEITHTDLAQYFYHGLGRKGLHEVIRGLIDEGLVGVDTLKGKSKPKLLYKAIIEEGEGEES